MLYRMPEVGEAATAELEREHHDLVCSIPTQAHVKAVSPGEAPSLALSDAKAMAQVPPAKLAKLRGDLTRVEGSLPRSALQESWDADRWRKVMTSVCKRSLQMCTRVMLLPCMNTLLLHGLVLGPPRDKSVEEATSGKCKCKGRAEQ